MKSITVQELRAMRDAGAEHHLIDVREPHEYAHCNLGGELIPLATVTHNADRISRDQTVVFM